MALVPEGVAYKEGEGEGSNNPLGYLRIKLSTKLK
jgi:hypothetical protein